MSDPKPETKIPSIMSEIQSEFTEINQRLDVIIGRIQAFTPADPKMQQAQNQLIINLSKDKNRDMVIMVAVMMLESEQAMRAKDGK